MSTPTRNIGMPQVTVTTLDPCTAYAGFATALKLDGIECLVITSKTTDAMPLMKATGLAPVVDLTGTRAVAGLSRDDVEVLK